MADDLKKVEVMVGSLNLEWPLGSSPVRDMKNFSKGDVLEMPFSRVKKLGHGVKIIDDERFNYVKMLQEREAKKKAKKDPPKSAQTVVVKKTVEKPLLVPRTEVVMQPPRFSIVMLTYNKKKTLLPHLELLRKQLEKGDEIIVVDDGSTDGTKERLSKLKWLRYRWREHKGFRAASMRNIGISMSKNAFIVSTDADCFPDASLLSRYRRAAKPGMLLHGMIYMEKDRRGRETYEMFGGSGNMCFYKPDAQKIGFFSEEYDGDYGYADMDFSSKMKAGGAKVSTLRTAVVRHKWHPTPKDRNVKANLKTFEKKRGEHEKGELPPPAPIVKKEVKKPVVKVEKKIKPKEKAEEKPKVKKKYVPPVFNIAELGLPQNIMKRSFLKHAKHYKPWISTLLPVTYNVYKLNIVIPSYNQRHQVEVCLHKLLPQMEPFDELVVVDDGSTDGTWEVVRDLQKRFPRLKLIRQDHQGIAEARNKGVLSFDYGSYKAGNVILWNVEIDPPPNILKAYRSNLLFDPPIDRLPVIPDVKKKIDLKTLTVGFYAETNHATAIDPVYEIMRELNYPVFRIEGVKSLNERGRFFADRERPFIIPDADIYLTCTSEHWSYRRFEPSKTVFALHGLNPIELSCFPAHLVNRFLASFLPGPWWLEQLEDNPWNKQYGETTFPPDFFHIVGWPKGDLLFRPEIKHQAEYLATQYPLNLKLPKTVLYAPTGFYLHGYSSFNGTIFALIKAAHSLGVNLIIKDHPHLDRKEESREVIKAAQKEVRNLAWGRHTTWVKWSDLADITPLYHLADVLVSDASSTVLEFLLTGKPNIEMMNRGYDRLGVFHKDWARWTQWKTAVGNYKGPADELPKNHPLFDWWRGCFMPTGSTIRCWTADDLEEALASALEHPEKGRAERRRWREQICGPADGRSSERTVKALLEVAGKL